MYKKNQLVIHYGNICEISNIFFNRDNKKCCDILNIDGSEMTVVISELYPYLGNMCLTEFRKRRNSNLFKNKIYINSLLFIFIVVITMILSFNGVYLF